MLKTLEEIYKTSSIELNDAGERTPLHSHTPMAQGLFLQEVFEKVKPVKSLEVGFAYGISTLFILEMHRKYNSAKAAHIVIEPDSYWGPAAVHNIEKEGLADLLDIRRDYSDKVLTKLFHDNYRIQYAYIDTTKQFDVVMQDFYFINKILDTGGVVILDDCEWPGIQRVARFINTLPHYKIFAAHNPLNSSTKKRLAQSVSTALLKLVPFKKHFYPTADFSTGEQLQLNYSCIAFQKIAEDSRKWDWDKPF